MESQRKKLLEETILKEIGEDYYQRQMELYLLRTANTVKEAYVALGTPRELFAMRLGIAAKLDNYPIIGGAQSNGVYHIESKSVIIHRDLIDDVFLAWYNKQHNGSNADECLGASTSLMNVTIAHELSHCIRHSIVQHLPYDFEEGAEEKIHTVSDEGLATFASKVIEINRQYYRNNLLRGSEIREMARYEKFIKSHDVEPGKSMQGPDNADLHRRILTVWGYMIGNAAASEARKYDAKGQNRMLGEMIGMYDDLEVVSNLLELAENSNVIDCDSARRFNSLMKGTGLFFRNKEHPDYPAELPLFLRR